MAFAEVSDIEARWRDLSTSEEERAGVLLDDASAMLTALVDIDQENEQQAALLKIVCCSMVIRAMSATESDAYGVDSMSMTAGPYAQTWNYNSPSGDMYLTKSEKLMLGLYGGYIGTIRPMMAGDHDD